MAVFQAGVERSAQCEDIAVERDSFSPVTRPVVCAQASPRVRPAATSPVRPRPSEEEGNEKRHQEHNAENGSCGAAHTALSPGHQYEQHDAEGSDSCHDHR